MTKKQPTLEEQIERLHQRIDELVAQRVAEEAKIAPGVPSGVLEQCLTGRAGGCRCAAARLILGRPEMD